MNDKSNSSDWSQIDEIAGRVVQTSGKSANGDTIMCAIVCALLEKGFSRTLIDEYFKSDSSALKGKWKPEEKCSGWSDKKLFPEV